jgi:glycosyltransferase involved in cell wall biosynthesis
MISPVLKQSRSLKTNALLSDGCAKILEIGPYPPPYNGWSTRIWVVKTGLEQAGHICVPLNLGENRKTPSPDYECVCSGWEYLRKLVRYALRGYVYHIHTNGDSLKGFFLNLIAYFVSMLTMRRPILTFHAGTDQIYFPREKSRIMVPLFKFLCGVAKAVICDNPDVARCIIDYGIRSEKVFPISPFTKQYLDLPPHELDNNLERFLTSHTPAVLTYLECRPEYDVNSLFQVVGKLSLRMPRLGLLVVGATRDGETIKTLAHAAGLADCYLHLGAIDHTAFLALLKRVSVYLRSAKTEGVSASIREALYFGVPVVANAADSHPEGVFVYPWGNAAAMIETLETVLANSDESQIIQIQPNELNISDTVTEEVDLLVRCALGESICRLEMPLLES